MAVDLTRLAQLAAEAGRLTAFSHRRLGDTRSPLLAKLRTARLLDYDPWQLRDPHSGEWIDTGVPEAAKKWMRTVAHVRDLADAVDGLREGHRHEVSRLSLSGGASGAGVDLVTLDDGTKLIHKHPAPWAGADEAKGELDAEQLASLVAASFGVPVAGVYRDERGATWSSYVPGKTMGELDDNGHPPNRQIDHFLKTQESKRMGFVHMLIGNNDANSGNLIVAEDGSVTGIDHSFAFAMLGYANGGQTPSPADLGPPEDRPISHFIDRGSGVEPKFINNPLTESDVERAREILDGLQPHFHKLGRDDWLEKMVQMLDELDLYADGEVNLL
jgi:hypothetical protein